MTVLDIAAQAGVSKSTVSLVLHDGALIRRETADRVRHAASELGDVYNRRAAELRRRASGTIGVLINDLMNPFFAEALGAARVGLAGLGLIWRSLTSSTPTNKPASRTLPIGTKH